MLLSRKKGVPTGGLCRLLCDWIKIQRNLRIFFIVFRLLYVTYLTQMGYETGVDNFGHFYRPQLFLIETLLAVMESKNSDTVSGPGKKLSLSRNALSPFSRNRESE